MKSATSALVARIRSIRGLQAVKRNLERFPSDFAFQLTEQEVRALRSQIVTLDEADDPLLLASAPAAQQREI